MVTQGTLTQVEFADGLLNLLTLLGPVVYQWCLLWMSVISTCNTFVMSLWSNLENMKIMTWASYEHAIVRNPPVFLDAAFSCYQGWMCQCTRWRHSKSCSLVVSMGMIVQCLLLIPSCTKRSLAAANRWVPFGSLWWFDVNSTTFTWCEIRLILHPLSMESALYAAHFILRYRPLAWGAWQLSGVALLECI